MNYQFTEQIFISDNSPKFFNLRAFATWSARECSWNEVIVKMFNKYIAHMLTYLYLSKYKMLFFIESRRELESQRDSWETTFVVLPGRSLENQ